MKPTIPSRRPRKSASGRTVQNIVEGIVGPGAARVQVNAELDLNKVQQTSETFDPEGRVVRSTQTVSRYVEGSEQDRSRRRPPAPSNNVPGGGASTSGSGGEANSNERTEETTNYEISKTTKTEVIESGRIRRLSVAVAVDGIMTPAKDGKGEPTWSARPAEDVQRITALVRAAVGYDEARGDKVEVVATKFARPEDRWNRSGQAWPA